MSIEQMLRRTARWRLERRGRRRRSGPLEMVRAGDHCSRRMSRQIEPFALILWGARLVELVGWLILAVGYGWGRRGMGRREGSGKERRGGGAGNVLGVVDLGGEGDLGRLERVVGREGDGEEEDSAGVRAIGLGERRERER